MSLKFDGDYYAKATDAGPRVPPSFPSDRFKQNYGTIQWNKEVVKMDYSSAPTQVLINAVRSGSIELGELPISRRLTVSESIAQIERIIEEKLNQIETMTKKQLEAFVKEESLGEVDLDLRKSIRELRDEARAIIRR